jgi:hypothetical protein
MGCNTGKGGKVGVRMGKEISDGEINDTEKKNPQKKKAQHKTQSTGTTKSLVFW